MTIRLVYWKGKKRNIVVASREERIREGAGYVLER